MKAEAGNTTPTHPPLTEVSKSAGCTVSEHGFRLMTDVHRLPMAQNDGFDALIIKGTL